MLFFRAGLQRMLKEAFLSYWSPGKVKDVLLSCQSFGNVEDAVL